MAAAEMLEARRNAAARVQQLRELHERSSEQYEKALFDASDSTDRDDAEGLLRMAQSKGEAKDIIWEQYMAAEQIMRSASTAWLQAYEESLELQAEERLEKVQQADLTFIEAVGGLQA